MRNGIVGDLVQLVGVIFLGSGITLELTRGGDIFLVVITIGCILFTIGTKIKGN